MHDDAMQQAPPEAASASADWVTRSAVLDVAMPPPEAVAAIPPEVKEVLSRILQRLLDEQREAA